MTTGRDITRSAFAWLLLFILFAQRIVCLVGGEIVYAVEVESRMTSTEETIVERIRSEKGLNLQVAVKDQAELEHLLKLGYSTPFIYSEEIDGQTVFYTLDDDPATADEVQYATRKTSDAEFPPNTNRALKDKLIADFYFWESAFQLQRHAFIKLSGSSLPSYWQAPFIPILSPPPKTA